MSLSYSLRLLSLCFAAFFLVHAAAGMAVWLAERPAARFAERIATRSAVRVLLALRILPVLAAMLFVLGVCAPSYVRFEPEMAGEQVGFACLTLAFLGALICALAVGRGWRATIRSARFARACRRSGRIVRLRGEPSAMFVIRASCAFLMQSGISRPQLVISERLLSDFSAEELEAALEHERAHWRSRDNLKRLFLAYLPGILPFWNGLDSLEENWAKFAERSADDCVSAEGVGPALSLAAALIRFARVRGSSEPASALRLASSLGGSDDLAGRVERLLNPPSSAARFPASVRALWAVGGIFMTGFLAALASPMLQWSVHELLERLIR